jgi:hypothetical protein
VIQGLAELQRIHQGLAASILPIKLVETFALDQERGNLFAIAVHPDPAQISSIAQEKRPTEDIRDLKDMLIHSIHLLFTRHSLGEGGPI